jgi:thioredoxin reductase (NADPH)
MAERASIIVVDDESDALAAMLDALTRRFGADYRVVPYLSPGSALAGVRKSSEENEEVALVIADQRMPEMTGREFLGRVRSIVPTAKRALLVEWGDREVSSTILQACALGELDNYLYKAVGTRGNSSIPIYWGVLGGMDDDQEVQFGQVRCHPLSQPFC